MLILTSSPYFQIGESVNDILPTSEGVDNSYTLLNL